MKRIFQDYTTAILLATFHTQSSSKAYNVLNCTKPFSSVSTREEVAENDLSVIIRATCTKFDSWSPKHQLLATAFVYSRSSAHALVVLCTNDISSEKKLKVTDVRSVRKLNLVYSLKNDVPTKCRHWKISHDHKRRRHTAFYYTLVENNTVDDFYVYVCRTPLLLPVEDMNASYRNRFDKVLAYRIQSSDSHYVTDERVPTEKGNFKTSGYPISMLNQ